MYTIHPPHPAQLCHTGHVEGGLRVLVGVVLPEEVVDFVIVCFVLVHKGGLDELWVCPRDRQVWWVKLRGLPHMGEPPQPAL